MNIIELFVQELDREVARSRKALALLPDDTRAWKPHEKSFSIGHLTQLVATMPGWLVSIAQGKNIDLATGGQRYSYEKTEDLLATFDKLVADARAAMAPTSDEDYAKPWSLTMGDKVLATSSRATFM